MCRDTFVDQMIQCMLNADREAAQKVVDRALSGGVSRSEVLTRILDKAMHEMGEGWHRNDFSLAQTFVAAKIAEDTLMRCMPEKTGEGENKKKGVVVIGNIEDDFHSLGRRIVGAFLRSLEWEVIDLGNDVLAEDFLEQAKTHQAKLIGVSAMMRSTALNIRKLRDLIDRQGLKSQIRLAVGGAAFNWQPELVNEVGGDGTSNSAFGADDLFTRLKKDLT
ncbi:MAG: cobalamin-dependent protein [Candidatus Riflebacteria bacterium]